VLLESNVKDESEHLSTIDVPVEAINDLDMSADIAADEFVMLDGEGNPTDEEFAGSSDETNENDDTMSVTDTNDMEAQS